VSLENRIPAVPTYFKVSTVGTM